jgi:hypothetical protein
LSMVQDWWVVGFFMRWISVWLVLALSTDCIMGIFGTAFLLIDHGSGYGFRHFGLKMATVCVAVGVDVIVNALSD